MRISGVSGLVQFANNDTQKATFSGSIYRKQLAKYGEWVNPQYPGGSNQPTMVLDHEWGQKIIANFEANTLGTPVPVPLTHTNDPKANTGRVQSLESIPNDGLYGNLLIKDPDTIKDLDLETIFDCSISFDWDYIRTDGTKSYGPTLLHVALVNNPYLTEMSSFEKVGPALSRLEESFNQIGLSDWTRDVIMLSKDKIKELSNMATATIKNDKDFDVVVSYKEGDEDKEATLEAGAELTVPEDVAESVTAQIIDAQAPEQDKSDNAGDDSKSDDSEDENTELSRLRKENAELKLSKTFDELLSQKKVIPAQKEKFMELANLSSSVELSKEKDITSVVLELLSSGKPQFSTDETGSSLEEDKATEDKSQDDEGKKPSERLSEAELAGAKAVGVTPEQMDKLAEQDPVYAEALASLSK